MIIGYMLTSHRAWVSSTKLETGLTILRCQNFPTRGGMQRTQNVLGMQVDLEASPASRKRDNIGVLWSMTAALIDMEWYSTRMIFGVIDSELDTVGQEVEVLGERTTATNRSIYPVRHTRISQGGVIDSSDYVYVLWVLFVDQSCYLPISCAGLLQSQNWGIRSQKK